MPEVQSFLTLQGLQAYGIILTEQQYLALCALVDNYTCACLAKLQQTVTYINGVAASYAGIVYLTQAAYDALTPEQKMDATKIYATSED